MRWIWVRAGYRLDAVHALLDLFEQLDVDFAGLAHREGVVVFLVLAEVVLGFADEAAVLLVEEHFVLAFGVFARLLVQVHHDLQDDVVLGFGLVLERLVDGLQPLLFEQDGHFAQLFRNGLCLFDEDRVLLGELRDELDGGLLAPVCFGLGCEHQLEDDALGVPGADELEQVEDVSVEHFVGDV